MKWADDQSIMYEKRNVRKCIKYTHCKNKWNAYMKMNLTLPGANSSDIEGEKI